MDSSSLISDICTSLECVFFTILLFWLYYKQSITAIELIIYSFATSTFIVPFISNTITPFFFVTTYFFISEAVALVRNKTKLNTSLIIILFLPVVSSIAIAVMLLMGIDVFDETNPSVGRVFYDALFFYVKYFLPMLFLGTKLYRDSKTYNAEHLFSIIKKVAIVSCYIALLQLLVTFITKDDLILRVIGLRPNYVSFEANGQAAATARVSAFFIEPKFFASFLVIAFPLFLREKKIAAMALIIVAGLLTASQTFLVGILISIILFFIIKKIHNIRYNIALGLITIIGTFFIISQAKLLLYDFYTANSDNYVVSLLLSRAIERYDVTDPDAVSADFLGIPLQKDSDLPIVFFFATKPLLYLSGYGLKNGGFVSPRYYIFNDDGFKVTGSLTYNLDLRWFYFSCEFGVIIFFIWLIFFTQKFDGEVVSVFESKYYAFLITFLFFNGVELFIMLLYALYLGASYYKDKPETAHLALN